MEENTLTVAQSATLAFLSTASATLGWRGMLFILWIFAMVLDYITGTVAALKSGQWSSTKAREGLFHKGGTIAVILVAIVLDVLIKMLQQSGVVSFPVAYNAVMMPVALAWYTVTDLGSTIENAELLGAPVPAWLRKAIKSANRSVDYTADSDSSTEQNET